MHFRIQPTVDERERACAAVASAIIPPGSNVVRMAFLVLGGVGGLLLPLWPPAGITLLLTTAGIVGLQFIMQGEARSRMRRARAGDPHANEPFEIEVGPDGIRS